MPSVARWRIEPELLENPARYAEPRSRRVPSWLLSLGLHFFVLLAAGLTIRVAPRGAAKEADRTGGIVLVENQTGEPRYLQEGDEVTEPTAAEATTDSPESATSPLAALPNASDSPPLDVGAALPLPGDGAIGDAIARAGALPNVGEFTQIGRPSKTLPGNKVETGVFGVTGTGTKFVYVFDRSGSMNSFNGRPLAAAKSELVKSLESLDNVHQFQIIFYNDKPTVFNPFPGQAPKLMFGDSPSKSMAAGFINGIRADGGTRHLDALKLALAMSPDVIFFLTDADEPQMTQTELNDIRRRNQRIGASINAIEFGVGSQRGYNFLMRLATDNGGKHAYVDVSRLRVP